MRNKRILVIEELIQITRAAWNLIRRYVEEMHLAHKDRDRERLNETIWNITGISRHRRELSHTSI